jgi:hypothetical protein
LPLRSGLLPRATNRALHFTRSASPSVVPSQRALSAHCAGRAATSSFELPAALPPARLWHPCRVPLPAAFGLTPVLPLAKGLGRVHHVSVKEPWLVRPEMPSIVEKPFPGSAPVPRLCRREPSPGFPSLVAVARFELAVRPPARPRPGLRVNGRCHSPNFCNCKEYEHTGERPIPASKRARDRLVSLRLASCPAKRAQATRQTEPKLRRRRSAAASTEEHVESASALRRIGRLVEPRTPRWSPPRPTHGAGGAGMRVASV